ISSESRTPIPYSSFLINPCTKYVSCERTATFLLISSFARMYFGRYAITKISFTSLIKRYHWISRRSRLSGSDIGKFVVVWRPVYLNSRRGQLLILLVLATAKPCSPTGSRLNTGSVTLLID